MSGLRRTVGKVPVRTRRTKASWGGEVLMFGWSFDCSWQAESWQEFSLESKRADAVGCPSLHGKARLRSPCRNGKRDVCCRHHYSLVFAPSFQGSYQNHLRRRRHLHLHYFGSRTCQNNVLVSDCWQRMTGVGEGSVLILMASFGMVSLGFWGVSAPASSQLDWA